LLEIAKEQNVQIVLPLHPRSKKKLEELPEKTKSFISNHSRLKLIAPATFLEMISLEKNAKLIITDSGGVQKEAYFFKKPCIILREQTEWVEILDAGCGLLAGSSKSNINDAVKFLLDHSVEFPPIFGDGKAAEFICKTMLNNQNANNMLNL